MGEKGSHSCGVRYHLFHGERSCWTRGSNGALLDNTITRRAVTSLEEVPREEKRCLFERLVHGQLDCVFIFWAVGGNWQESILLRCLWFSNVAERGENRTI